MVKQEWKELFHNTWFKIVMIAIIIIPCVYAGVFLGSMWDPYGNTGSIPIAVVNQDKKVSYNEQSLNVGEELVKNLEDNDSMDFHFVSKEDALKGLEDGRYYMVITIPSDFSKNATTLLNEHPKKMILDYTTNPGTNYIASKMDDSAITKIKTEVSTSVTETYAKTIFGQIQTLSSGLNDAAKGTTQLGDGVHQLIDGNQLISDNLKTLASSSLIFQDGAQSLNNGLMSYTDGLVTIDNGVYTLKTGLDQLNNSTDSLSQGITQLNDGTQSLTNGITQYTVGVNQVYQGTQALVSQNKVLSEGVVRLSQGTQQLSTGNQKVVAGVNDLSDKINSAKTSLSAYLDLYNILSSQSATRSYAATLKENGLSAQQVSLLTHGQITEALPSFEGMLKTINTNMTALSGAVDTELKSGVNQVQVGLNNLNASINGSPSVGEKGIESVPKEKSLVYGIQAYLQGTSQVNSGLAQLDGNSQSLNTGGSQLTQGMKSMMNQTPTLVTGIQALDYGAKDLYKGTNLLVSNNSTILSGSLALKSGSQQIGHGANQLANGSSTLGQGLHDVQTGTNTLDTSLNDGAKESQISTNDRTYTMMASPVETTHHEISTVENNGHAMAPYMMSVALYVACLAFALMYPLLKDVNKAKSGIQYWLSKSSIWFFISTVAALAMIGTLMLFNGFHPQQTLMTFLFAVVVAAAFMSLVTLLSITTGRIGEFLLLIFMVINLGGSAGTYPLETSSAIYKIIHPFVPFTYSVNGFRKVISQANASINTELIIFLGILIVSSILTILVYNHRIKKPTPLIPQAFEENN